MLKILSFVIFLILSAFFSSAETAFTAFNKVKVRALSDKKEAESQQLHRILKNPRKLLTAILIGNNIANIGASAMATTVMMDVLRFWGIRNVALELLIVTTGMTILLLIVGEITPKTLAIKSPERLAKAYTPFIRLWMIVMTPVVVVFLKFSSLLSRLFRIPTSDAQKIMSEDDMRTVVTIAEEEGLLEQEETRMINSIFEFSDKIVREIMTPRTDAVCINVNDTVSDAIALILDKGHSRIPVYEEKIDNILGIIYAKDLLTVSTPHEPPQLRKFMREAVFIPETKNTSDLLHQMQKTKFHLAIVVDEYGGMSGLVTMEDIIEEILGEIQDEYDKEDQADFVQTGPNTYVVDAGLNVDDLGEKLGIEFPDDEDYDTVGGMVLSLLGKFPAKGETVPYKNIYITVKDVTKRRILRVEISVDPTDSTEEQPIERPETVQD